LRRGVFTDERLPADAICDDVSFFKFDECVEATWSVPDSVLEDASGLAKYKPDTVGRPQPSASCSGRRRLA
jgi:hypothetical protein